MLPAPAVASVTISPTVIPAVEDIPVILLGLLLVEMLPVGVAVDILSAQLPAAKNTVSPLDAAFIAAWMHWSVQGLPVVPLPPPFEAQYVAAASYRVPTVIAKFCFSGLPVAPACVAATQIFLVPAVIAPLVSNVSFTIWNEALSAPLQPPTVGVSDKPALE